MQNNYWKVGAFVTAASLAFAGVILFFGEIPIHKDTTEYYAYFKNVAGLSKGADVRVAGVKVGKVKEITFESGKVKVVLEIKKNVPIYSDAVAKIESLGLLGDKYVEIDPGHPTAGLLKPHAVIAYTKPPVDTSKLIEALTQTSKDIDKLSKSLYALVEENRRELTELVRNLNLLAANLNQLTEENRENIKQTLENIKVLAANLNRSLPELTRNYSLLAKNLNDLVTDTKPQLKETLKNLASLSRTLNEEVPKLVKSVKETSDVFAQNKSHIEETLKNLAQITEKINRGKGTLGRLVNDRKLYKELTKSVQALGQASKVVLNTQLHVEAFGQYETEGDSKAGVNLMIQPDEHKYYLLGIVGDSAGKVTKKTYYQNGKPYEVTEKEYKPEFNIQYARIFADRWLHPGSSIVVRFGIKESTGGIGFDYVYNPKLMFTFDMWDFGREDHPDEDLKPNTELGFKYFVMGPFFVKAGGYDLLNEEYRSVYIGGGMSFTDNDLKYLLGGMKLGSF
jgi:phospholipid/cholesterol/gamma-HCH transport system substrate-binding protein